MNIRWVEAVGAITEDFKCLNDRVAEKLGRK